jgi:hypothetical protein
MSLYNAKTSNGAFRITKFDGNLEVESSYLTTVKECECPAGSRPTCRHRQMLPEFIAHERVDTYWFLDWDHRKWADPFHKAWRRI